MKLLPLAFCLYGLGLSSCLLETSASSTSPRLVPSLDAYQIKQGSSTMMVPLENPAQIFQNDSVFLNLTLQIESKGQVRALDTNESPWDYLNKIRWSWAGQEISSAFYLKIYATDTGWQTLSLKLIDRNEDTLWLSHRFKVIPRTSF